ncbi:MAG: desulfoferrodoxin [Lachnospiraceae bacterium]|nr:desulfoferrodoxin [Lachnospiraceae bacterium]
MTFYICKGCGKIIGMIRPSKCPTKCCGEPMEEMIPNTTDAALEKHVPVVEISGRDVKVTVGSALHPMMEEHYIMWIALETKQGAQRKSLVPGAAPCASFALAEGDEVVAAYEYCNLHGLWKKEV